MATRTTVTLIDDLDNTTEATETVGFRLDGTTYEIDLSPDNAAALRAILASYVVHARRAPKDTRPATAPTQRRTTKRTQRQPSRPTNGSDMTAPFRAPSPEPASPQPTSSAPERNGASGMHPEQRQHVRDWARRHGYSVGERGRIPARVLEAYRAQPLSPSKR